MTLPFIVDSHCHLDFPDFDGERDALIARAADKGVRLMVTISTKVERLPVLLEIAEAYPNVYATVGTHPNSAAEEPDVPTERLVALSAHRKLSLIHI